MNHIKAMKQWLYALEMGRDAAFQAAEMFHLEMRGYKQQRHEALDAEVKQIDEAIASLRTAIEAAEKQEPVATLWQHGETGRTRVTMPGDITDCDAQWFRAADLYTTPPAAPVQEPVAWMWKDGTITSDPDRADGTWTPLYTSPQPSKPWVGLDQHDIDVLFLNEDGVRFARYIEAKLKEKNT